MSKTSKLIIKGKWGNFHWAFLILKTPQIVWNFPSNVHHIIPSIFATLNQPICVFLLRALEGKKRARCFSISSSMKNDHELGRGLGVDGGGGHNELGSLLSYWMENPHSHKWELGTVPYPRKFIANEPPVRWSEKIPPSIPQMNSWVFFS